MATFETNFYSYCRGRPTTMTVMIPTAGPFDVGFQPIMKTTLLSDPHDYTTTVDYVPYYQRMNSADHTPKAKYPVLYLLSGGQQDRNGWRDNTQAMMFCEERKMALVMVDGESTEWHLERELEFLSREVPQFVCGMFPISERPEDTYIAGFSRGTGGAIHHMLYTPERFAAVGLFSSSITYYEDNLVGMAKEFFAKGGNLPPIYMSIGSNDHGKDRFCWYSKLLSDHGARVEYLEEPGFTHSYRLCNVALEKFLDWIPRTDAYAKDTILDLEYGDGGKKR